MRSLLVLSLLASLLPFGVRADPLFTDATGPKCKVIGEDGTWICPGPGGYAVRFSDEGNLIEIAFAPERLIRKAPATAHWLAANKGFGDKVEWIMRDGAPRAAVIRTWRRKDVNDPTEVQELMVFVLEHDRACSYSEVDAHRLKANKAATAEAEQAAN